MSRTERDHSLQKTFHFKTFQDAIQRMVSCKDDIDQLDHHPERTNIYNRVDVVLRTHDAGNIVTEKDHQLAKLLDNHYIWYSTL